MANKRILIVDDQMDWRLLVRMSLENYDVEIIEADDGQKGINLAQSANPDLIIMDNNMPVLSGYEAIKRIKADPACRTVPIIMLTSKGFDAQMKEMIMLDVSEFISKPFEEEHLIASIEKIIGKLPEKTQETGQPAQDKEIVIGKKIIIFMEDDYVKKNIIEIAGDRNKVIEVKTKDELLEQSKKLLPDYIISDLQLTDWNGAVSMEVLSFALTNNIPVIIDLSRVPNDGLKRILEAKNTSLFELKPVRIQEILEEE